MFGLAAGLAVRAYFEFDEGGRLQLRPIIALVRSNLRQWGKPVPFSREECPVGGVSEVYYRILDKVAGE